MPAYIKTAGSLKNAAFSRKIEGDEAGRPGYKQNTLLLLTREVVDCAKNDPTWDEMHIKKRQAELYKEFVALLRKMKIHYWIISLKSNWQMRQFC